MRARVVPDDGKSIRDFLPVSEIPVPEENAADESYFDQLRDEETFSRKKFYIETYGCQMNVSDSEIVESILGKAGYARVDDSMSADAILINTCSIRDKAEEKVWHRLRHFRNRQIDYKAKSGQFRVFPSSPTTQDLPKMPSKQSIAVLGCMAERLKDKLLIGEKKLADVVVGPDAYRDLPRLLENSLSGQRGVNVMLSLEETYADISPVRSHSNGVSAYVSIMRGCNNMCSYCIVPFTRGRERSRHADSIVEEIQRLSSEGYKEVMLLGQNVNSYNDTSLVDGLSSDEELERSKGFKSIVKVRKVGTLFAELLERVARVDPEMRIRFTSPHPKDFPDPVLDVIASYPNVCNQIHIPAQSGSSSVLERMRRGYTREAYIELIERIKEKIPDVSLSSDFITGFCGETEEEHQDTVSLLNLVKYDQAFMFAYSQREKTSAHRRFADDVPADIKQRRLGEIIETFRRNAKEKSQSEIGKVRLVLIEGEGRKNGISGRNEGNKNVIIHERSTAVSLDDWNHDQNKVEIRPGDYIAVYVTEANQTSLRGIPLTRTSLKEFHSSIFQSKVLALLPLLHKQ